MPWSVCKICFVAGFKKGSYQGKLGQYAYMPINGMLKFKSIPLLWRMIYSTGVGFSCAVAKCGTLF